MKASDYLYQIVDHNGKIVDDSPISETREMARQVKRTMETTYNRKYKIVQYAAIKTVR